MRIASTMALVAALAFTVFSSAAMAGGPSTAPGPNGGGDPGHPGGGNPCTAICGTAEVKQPKDCSDKLRPLPVISARDILDIGEDQRMHIAAVCDLVANHSLTDATPQEVSRGNVTGLRPAIEGNPLVMAELDEHGYKSGDVIGILIGSNAAVLYVHKM